MKWLVALAPRDPAPGPLTLVRSLKERSPEQQFSVVSVCSVETESTHDVELLALRGYLQHYAPGIEFEGVRVVHGSREGKGILQALEAMSADALVVSRRAKRADAGLAYLGRVPRWLVRRSTLPVIVTPPILPESLGQGPLLVAVERREQLAALDFARRLASELRRDVEIVSIVAEPAAPGWAPLHEPPDVLGHRRAERTRGARAKLAAWQEQHGATDVRATVRMGSLLEELLRFAEEKESPLLVCGRRRRSGLSRLVFGGTGASLARHARCPVAVVPL